MIDPPVRAVVWDFDNTLVDSSARNYAVTRRIIRTVTGRDPEAYAALASQAVYDTIVHELQNWQVLYREHFQLTADQIQHAGRLWTPFQAEDDTPAHWFDGIVETLGSVEVPQAIVSMNTRSNIERALDEANLDPYFRVVVGCGEVSRDGQKPAPDGLLRSFEALPGSGKAAGTILYVGDHPVDAQCASNARAALAEQGVEAHVRSVAASYGSSSSSDDWPVPPDYAIERPLDLLDLLGMPSAPF